MILINKIKAAAGKIFFLAAVFVYTAFLFGCKASGKNISEVGYLYPGDVNMWNHIYSQSEAFVIPQKMPQSIIIPHHDITAKEQNSFYKALSKVGQPSVVVVVAPDHFEVGKKQIVIPCNTFFDAPDGTLELYDELQKELTSNKKIEQYVDMTMEPWKNEHGIFIHTPFIKHYFPDSKFFPILVKSFSKDEEFEIYSKLADVLSEFLPEDALVIASVDFSHYQIPRMTELHDYVSMNTIQNGEDLKHIEVDSPESLTVTVDFAALCGAERPVLIDRTCTYDYIPDDFVVSTSHQYWAFYSVVSKEDEELLNKYRDEVAATDQKYSFADYENTKNQTILIGGSGSIGAGVRYTWDWDRYKTSKDSAEIKLHDLAGTEARFLEGFDALIFDVEPGQVYSSNLHNTKVYIKGIDAKEIDEEVNTCSKDFKQPGNKINILVVTNDFESELYKTKFSEFTILSQIYEVIVIRDSKGEKDAQVVLSKPEIAKQYPETYNLGILAGKGSIKGKILCINWYNGLRNIELFDYESDNGLPPPILQGEI